MVPSIATPHISPLEEYLPQWVRSITSVESIDGASDLTKNQEVSTKRVVLRFGNMCIVCSCRLGNRLRNGGRAGENRFVASRSRARNWLTSILPAHRPSVCLSVIGGSVRPSILAWEDVYLKCRVRCRSGRHSTD